MTDDLSTCRGFQWDEGNAEKNWVKHHVSRGETEQVFFNRPLMVVAGEQRVELTPRYDALGHTDAGRLLFVGCTSRFAGESSSGFQARSQFPEEANILLVITSPRDNVRGVAQRPCLILGEELS